MKFLAILPVAVLLVTACTDAPTAPQTSQQDEAAAQGISADGISLNLSTSEAGQSLNFDGDLDAISSRVLPNFDNVAAAGKLQSHIAEIKTQLAAGNKAGVAELTKLARAELTAGTADLGTSVGDLGWIELVLDNIDRAVVQ